MGTTRPKSERFGHPCLSHEGSGQIFKRRLGPGRSTLATRSSRYASGPRHWTPDGSTVGVVPRSSETAEHRGRRRERARGECWSTRVPNPGWPARSLEVGAGPSIWILNLGARSWDTRRTSPHNVQTCIQCGGTRGPREGARPHHAAGHPRWSRERRDSSRRITMLHTTGCAHRITKERPWGEESARPVFRCRG